VEIPIKAMVSAIDNYYRLDMFFLGKHFKSHACVPKMVNYRFFHPPASAKPRRLAKATMAQDFSCAIVASNSH
jgi:hypothetical protein